MKDFLFGDYIYDKHPNYETWTIKKLNPLVNSTELVIPRTVLTGRVAEIGANALFGNHKIESVTIPLTIDTILESAFGNCSALRELVFSPTNKCLSIDRNAFENCRSLRHLYFHRPVKLYSKAFYGCENIQIVKGKMQYVGRQTFAACKNLTELSFAMNVEIADSAFAFCKNIAAVKFAHNIIGSLDFMEYIPKTAKIYCREDSNLIELIYLGYNVLPFDEVFL